jgi:hypothetical protein
MMAYLLKEIDQQQLVNNAVGDSSKQQHFILTKVCPPKKIKNPRDSSKQCSQEHGVSASLDPTQLPVARQHGSTGAIILQSRSQGIGTSGKTYTIIQC